MAHSSTWRTLLLYDEPPSVTTRLSTIMGETIENALVYFRVIPDRAELALFGTWTREYKSR